MKFLVDAQLPKRFALLLNDLGYDVIHTLDLPDKNAASDVEINNISIAIMRSFSRLYKNKI